MQELQAIEQLRLLGYKDGDIVNYRTIGDTEAETGKLSETYPIIPARLFHLNQRRNIYAVVNSGGNRDAEITQCRAIFYEHDDLSKDEQLGLWQSLCLPEPTFQVDTGGKSIHSYWTLSEPITPDKWRSIQSDLLNFSDGDRSIKNPSRVMRLAGFHHHGSGAVATIVSRSGTTYSYGELRSIIPSVMILSEPKERSIDIENNSSLPPIPIERCLSKSHRDKLSGMAEGCRDNTAIAIARDLIGVATVVPKLEFDYRGHNYCVEVAGDPYQLFVGFAVRCSPSLTQRDIDRIWKSANNYAPSPAIADFDALKNCLRSWAKECLPSREVLVGRKSKRSISADAISLYESLASKLGLELVIDEEGEIESRLMKLTLDLYKKVGENLKLNLMTRDYEYLGKFIDLNHAKFWIAAMLGYDATTESCILAIHQVGEKHSYHPVNEYLEKVRSIEPDFSLLENAATQFLGNSDPLANRMLMKKLIAAVARVKSPGCKDDTLLVLQGAQGAKKSTFLKVLAGADWFCDDIRDLDNKDELAKLSRNWILELAEVDYLMGRKEVESFKRFLSTTTDTYRPPYGRANIRIDRTCAFFATTNKTEFLTDPTGDRRYWVIEVMGKIDCEQAQAHRDTIWATALAAYERGDTWWLDEADDNARASDNFKYRDSDPWLDEIIGGCSNLPTTLHGAGEYIKVSQIFDQLNLTSIQRDRKSSNRVVKVLMELGFGSKVVKIQGKAQKVWYREIAPDIIEARETEVEEETKVDVSVAGNVVEVVEASEKQNMVGDVQSEIFSREKAENHRCLRIGDRVQYFGADKTCQRQYAGVLIVKEVRGETYACLKACGTGLTSWIDREDLTVIVSN